MFSPTFVDIGIFIGTIGFFFVLFLLYSRTFPVIAQAEVKTILKSSGEHYKKIREAGNSLVGTGADKKTSGKTFKTETLKDKVSNDDKLKMTSSLLDSIGTFDPSTQKADDLKKISGVGPKMEEVLNSIGIYSFVQVSKMTKREYDLLDSITGSFPGRAERDDWSGQAKKLIK
tara:strand:- start:36715 stop:37233 length:519 start_codon:yes stop_codon:yes gene_type:complete